MNFTGLPVTLASAPAMPICLARKCFEPNEPPTDSGWKLSMCGATPRVADMTQAPKLSRLVLDQTSIRPLAASNRTTAPLVSSGAAVARGQRSSRRTTRSAAANSASTSPNVNACW